MIEFYIQKISWLNQVLFICSIRAMIECGNSYLHRTISAWSLKEIWYVY